MKNDRLDRATTMFSAQSKVSRSVWKGRSCSMRPFHIATESNKSKDGSRVCFQTAAVTFTTRTSWSSILSNEIGSELFGMSFKERFLCAAVAHCLLEASCAKVVKSTQTTSKSERINIDETQETNVFDDNVSLCLLTQGSDLVTHTQNGLSFGPVMRHLFALDPWLLYCGRLRLRAEFVVDCSPRTLKH